MAVIEAQTAAQETVIGAQATAQKRQVEGYTYQQERGFDVAEAVAGNQAVGEFANMGVGLGVMGGVGVSMGSMVGGAVSESMGAALGQQGNQQPVQTQPSVSVCPGCGAEVQSNWKLCPECGQQLQAPTCANCSAELKPTWKLCPECGTPRG